MREISVYPYRGSRRRTSRRISRSSTRSRPSRGNTRRQQAKSLSPGSLHRIRPVCDLSSRLFSIYSDQRKLTCVHLQSFRSQDRTRRIASRRTRTPRSCSLRPKTWRRSPGSARRRRFMVLATQRYLWLRPRETVYRLISGRASEKTLIYLSLWLLKQIYLGWIIHSYLLARCTAAADDSVRIFFSKKEVSVCTSLSARYAPGYWNSQRDGSYSRWTERWEYIGHGA